MKHMQDEMHFIGGCTCISYDQVSCFVRWFSLLKTIFAAFLNISKIAKVRKYKCSKNAEEPRSNDYLHWNPILHNCTYYTL
jgi:hypothetical protein